MNKILKRTLIGELNSLDKGFFEVGIVGNLNETPFRMMKRRMIREVCIFLLFYWNRILHIEYYYTMNLLLPIIF